MTNIKTDFLHVADQTRAYGSSTIRIASSFHYVYMDEPVDELSRAFQDYPELRAVAVVDRRKALKGIVVKDTLMNLLGRPYAIELFKRKEVSHVIQYTDSFYINRNILSVADIIDHKLEEDEISYYLLKNNEGGFAGIFSTRDMINYLSGISKQDIELARNLQERLVIGNGSFQGKNIQIQGYSRPAKGVGGDFYFVEKIDDDKWIIALCDVSGKGVAASLITTMLWGMMKIYDWRKGLKEFVSQLNDNIVQTFHLEKYLTGVFMIYNEKTQQFSLCDMGHSLIFLLRNGKMIELKSDAKNLPIGIETSTNAVVCRLEMQKGERLLLFTDGLIEQQNRSHQEFSIQRLSKILKKNPLTSISDLKDVICGEFQDYRKGVSQADDVTFLIVDKL